jgi:hypothetical protein
MFVDKFVCVFLAFNANAPSDAPEDYLALMESAKPSIELQSKWQFLVNDYVDQNGHLIVPQDNQYITSQEELMVKIEAGENVLASGRQDFPYSSREELQALTEERRLAVSEIEKAQNGENAQHCQFNVM